MFPLLPHPDAYPEMIRSVTTDRAREEALLHAARGRRRARLRRALRTVAATGRW